MDDIFEIPIFQTNRNYTYFFNETLFNRNILFLASVSELNYMYKIERISEFLSFKLYTKVLFITESRNLTVLKNILKYCWNHSMVNSIIYQLPNFKTIGYKPSPTFEIFEIGQEIFPDKLNNLYGLESPFAILYDPPRGFKYSFENRTYYGGFIWKIFQEFSKRKNISIFENSDYDILSKDPYKIINLLKNGSIDFTPVIILGHRYTYFLEYHGMCSYKYFRQTMVFDEYLKFTLFFKYFTFNTIFCNSFECFKQILLQKYLFSEKNLENCLRIFLFQHGVDWKVLKPNTRIFYGFMIYLNFIMISSFCAFLGSSLTVPGFPEINSFQDIRDQGIKLMIIKQDFDIIKNGKSSSFIPEKHFDDLKIVSFTEMVNHRDSFNTSFAYAMTTTKWTVFKKYQEFQNNAIFRLMNGKCSTAKNPISLTFGKHCKYQTSSGDFLNRIYSSGLNIKFESDSVFEMIRGNIIKNKIPKISSSKAKPLSISYYYVILRILSVLILISVIVFICEIVIGIK